MKKSMVLLTALLLAPLSVYGAPQKFIGMEIPLAASCGVKNPQEECRVSGEGSYGMSVYGGIPYGSLYLLGGISSFVFKTETHSRGENWEAPRESTWRSSFIEAGAAFPLGRIKKTGYPFFVLVQGLLGSANSDGQDASIAAGLKLGAMFVIDQWHFLGTARFIESQQLDPRDSNRLTVGALGIGYAF